MSTVAARDPHVGIWLDGVPLEMPANSVVQLEVEERADEASQFRLGVDMSPIDDDWDVLERGDFAEAFLIPRFSLLRRVTIELSLVRRDEDQPDFSAVVIDGYVTTVEPVFSDARVPDSQLIVSGTDASCLMHLEAKTRPWQGMTDTQVARQIFREYGFDAPDANFDDTGLVRDGRRSGLVQRCTDAEFLTYLARRNGYEWYLEPAGSEVSAGTHPGAWLQGHFHAPRPHQDLQSDGAALALFPRESPTLISFRARWESHQPASIRAWHLAEDSREVQRVDITEPGYATLNATDANGIGRGGLIDARLAEVFPEQPRPVACEIASREVPHGHAELTSLARGEYRRADWFVRGEGTVNTGYFPGIVRPRRPIALTGAGHLLDGRWYVLGVRHRFAVDSDQPEVEPTTRRYEADVTLVRNDLGGSGA
jgi:uncharacterized protein involved in type VI secretion and phage assembly